MSIRLKALLLAGPVTLLPLLTIGALITVAALLWNTPIPSADPAHQSTVRWATRMLGITGLVLTAIMILIRTGRLLVVVLAPASHEPGVDVSRAEAPALWEELDRLIHRVGAPPIHRLRLTGACNAGVRTQRRWLLGPHRNTLEFGLPLLILMDPEEARSVLIHELAHLRHDDTRRGVEGYTGGMLLAIASMDRHDTEASPGLLRRTADRFVVQLMGVRRNLEFQADAVAVAHAGMEVTGRGMMRIALASLRVAERVRDLLSDPTSVDLKKLQSLRRDQFDHATMPDPRDRGWLLAELARPTSPDEGHPCLSDRLRAMGISMPADLIPAPVAERDSAAFAWLGADRTKVRAMASDLHGTPDESAAVESTTAPEELGDAIRDLHARLSTLDPSLLQGLRSMAVRHGDPDAGRAAMQELLKRDIRDPLMLRWMLRVLLRSDDPDERAAADGVAVRLAEHGTKDSAALDGFAWACAHAGDETRARAIWRMLDRARLRDKLRAFHMERWLEPRDLDRHAMPDARLDELRTHIRERRWIGQAWLVRLHADAKLGPPCHALMIQRRTRRWWPESAASWDRRLRALGESVGADVELLDFGSLSVSTQERLRVMPDTRMV